jgi:DNA-binding NarL/FixJ family response regulator
MTGPAAQVARHVKSGVTAQQGAARHGTERFAVPSSIARHGGVSGRRAMGAANGPIRVVLVDDHRVVRRGLRAYLDAFPDLTIVGEASSGEEVLGALADGRWQPDVILMDLLMPGGIDGIEATRRLRETAPGVAIVVLTSAADDARVIAALRAGALGYVLKEAEPELLLAAVRSAAQGRAVLDPAVTTAVLHGLSAPQGGRGTALTTRERDVLRLLARGLANKQIADELTIGEETVKTHGGNILGKLGVAHRTEAAIVAQREGLVE